MEETGLWREDTAHRWYGAVGGDMRMNVLVFRWMPRVRFAISCHLRVCGPLQGR